MADLIKSVQDMLKEETWTRATINNYTENNLKELANIVENQAMISDRHALIMGLCTH